MAVRPAPAAEELSRTRGAKPADALVEELEVAGAERISPGFVRVTLRPVDPRFAERFRPVGADQWFRLFLPGASGALALPWGGAEGWYTRLRAMPDAVRPTVRNYTVRAVRRGGSGLELDVDFVVHGDGSGDSAGSAAGWALGAQPGDRVGFLDQGVVFSPAPDARRLVIVADETGVPGVEGVLASLPADARATVLLEVPHANDARELPSGAEVDLRWAVRAHPAGSGRSAVLDTLATGVADAALAAADHVYAVGVAALALGVKERAEGLGVPRDRIDFCAYWRPSRRASA